MKRLFILIVLLSLLNNRQTTAFALENEGTFLRLIDQNSAFYRDSNCTDLVCNLPYTYYVKVIENLGEVYHVECYGNSSVPALDGYVKKDCLYKDDLDKSSPYAYKTIKTSSTAPFYSSISNSQPSMYVFKDREMTYYGFINSTSGTIYYFVDYNGKLGYVSEEFIIPFTLENHPNPLTFLTVKEPETEDPKTEVETQKKPSPSVMSEQNLLRMVIILLIIIAGFIAVFVSKNPKKRDKQTEIDYEDY
jgi:hypothetical protein